MSATLLLISMTAILTAAIGLGVWASERQSVVKWRFFVLLLTVSLWAATNGLVHDFASTPLGPLWGRLAFSAASLIASSLFLFAMAFPISSTTGRLVTLLRRTWVTGGVVFAAMAQTPLILVSTAKVDDVLKVTYGPLYVPYAIYFLTCFASGLYVLGRKLSVLSGTQRTQAMYVFAALSLGGTGASITNLLLPLTLGTSEYGRYGPFFTVLMLGLIGHAIVRHRLMNIRVAIKRGAVYLVAFLVAGVVLLALLMASSLLLSDKQHFAPVEVLLALAVAVLFHPLKILIQRAFDRYLYREPYDYPRIVRETSQALGDTIELRALLSCLGGVVTSTLKPEGAAVFLLEEEDRRFERMWVAGTQPDVGAVPATSSLVATLAARRVPIFRDELPTNDGSATDADLTAELDRLGAEVVVPLVEEERLIGFLVLGQKRSGNPYFSDDADLLVTLGNQSAVAIRNAQTHQRVVQVNEEIRKILSTIESGVIAVGPRGRITLFNRAAEQFTGLTAATAAGGQVGCLPPPLSHLLAATAQDGQSRSQQEFALPDAGGQPTPLVCSTSPLVGAEAQLVGAVAVISDLSRLKELELERRRADRLASLEAIASGLVHEIRNPLVAIKTFFQLVPVRFGDPGFRETFAPVAGKEVERIDELLDRLKTLASPSSQPKQPLDVAGPLQDIVDLLQPQLEERQIRLHWAAEGSLRQILANASQLKQLFLNLCLNAIEAMTPGGELGVRVADLSDGGGMTLLVEVSDTGCGIRPDVLDTLFDPFVTTKPRGSGLGLAICQSIADAHGARLSARNNAGRPGSTFAVEFPVSAVGAATVTL